MATGRDTVMEDFLTCDLCSNYCTDPCTLTCQHSFCQQCLTDYTKTKSESIKSKAIPCPSCNQMSNVPDSTRPVEEWVEQFKPSLALQGFTDTLLRGKTVTVSGCCCNICAQLRETTPATVWCHDCEIFLCDLCRRSHQVIPSSRDHTVGDISAGTKIHRRQNVLCREHKDEYIKFHCKDCNKSACQKCHQTCESVVTIESMMAAMTSFLFEKKKALSKRLKIKSLKVEATKTAIKNALQNRTDTVSEIQAVSRKIIDKIKQKEKELIAKLDEITEKQINQLQAAIKMDELDIQARQQHSEFIDQILNSQYVMDMYNMYQACQAGVLLRNERNTGTRQMIDTVCFTQDTDRFHSILDEIQLGEITTTCTNVCNPMSTPVLYNTTYCRTEDDREDPDLSDITVMFVDGVETTVVTDLSNNCLKSFYTRKNKLCHCTLSLDSTIWGIAKLKERNQVMVSVPRLHQIVTIEVTPDLVSLSTMTTNNKYWNLAVLGQTSLAAASVFPPRVDILNMEGQVMRTVSTHNTEKLFKYPSYLCVSNNGYLLVSDMWKKSVTCLTSEGDVVWTYTPTGDRSLGDPVGITTSSGGDILLVDSNPHKVIQLTESGQYVRDVLTVQDGLGDSRGVCLDRHGSLYVCEGNEIKEFILT